MVQRKPSLTPPVTVQAVEHCLKLIDALSANEQARGVTDLGAELGLAESRVCVVVPQNLFSGSRRGESKAMAREGPKPLRGHKPLCIQDAHPGKRSPLTRGGAWKYKDRVPDSRT